MAKKLPNPYYDGPPSDHFDGIRFFNPDGIEPKGMRSVLKWKFNGQRAKWPKSVPSPFAPTIPASRVSADELRVTMIGHASLLIQVSGLNILTDPVWSHRASPFNFAGPKRVSTPGIAFNDLPEIDVVLVTHNHYDHLDIATLRRLSVEHGAHIITPLGNDTVIHQSIPDAKISTMDWGDRLSYWDGISLDAEPCHHWSARGVADRSMALWASFVISTPAGKIYHVGDTGFHQGINYRAVQEKHGGFRLAILPIGAYEPRWFMKGQHQNPEEAVEAMALCNASHVAGHHFGTFQLTDEAIDAPVTALAKALSAKGITHDRFRPLHPGEVFDVPKASG